MMHNAFRLSLFISLLTASACVAAASAPASSQASQPMLLASSADDEERQESAQSHESSPQEPALSTEEAASQARDEHNGRVLSVKLENSQDGPYYRVKLLEQGRVRSVEIDADQ